MGGQALADGNLTPEKVQRLNEIRDQLSLPNELAEQVIKGVQSQNLRKVIVVRLAFSLSPSSRSSRRVGQASMLFHFLEEGSCTPISSRFAETFFSHSDGSCRERGASVLPGAPISIIFVVSVDE